MQWFGDSWNDKEVTFPAQDDQPSTTWKLGAKLADDKFNCWPRRFVTENSGPSVAWVPFVCEQVGASGPEYVMKIFMQCVYYIPPVVCSLTINGRC